MTKINLLAVLTAVFLFLLSVCRGLAASEEVQHPTMIPGGEGTAIAVYEFGNPKGDEILLVHGFSQSHLSWAPQYEAAELQGFRMVVIDLRGHGSSARPQTAEYYNNSDVWADDVHAVISAKKMQSPVIVGWSYGGFVISDYVRKYGDKALGGIVFVGAATQLGTEIAGGHLGPAGEWFPRMMDPRQEVNIEGTQGFLEACIEGDWPQEDFVEALAFNMMVSPAVRVAMLSRVIDGDDALAAISKPALLIHGEEDEVVLPASSRYIAERVPHARQSYYPETGHNPFYEEPARFNQELAAFVSGVN
ncbi:MAG: alpha/beta hydrolase [Pseudomonadota bacterium]